MDLLPARNRNPDILAVALREGDHSASQELISLLSSTSQYIKSCLGILCSYRLSITKLTKASKFCFACSWILLEELQTDKVVALTLRTYTARNLLIVVVNLQPMNFR